MDLVDSPISFYQARTEREASDKQMLWHDEICKNMAVVDGYERVGVLIIKWINHLDQLDCEQEVKQLDALFKNRFHYETRIAELTAKTNPSLQLMSAVVEFAREYDGPSNLVIVYYTGHSEYNKDLDALVSAKCIANHEVCSEGCSYPPCAFWPDAESVLLGPLDADALTILDTCFASNSHKGGASTNRAYQMLAASGLDRTTSGPGPKSFTAAMIDSLSDLLDEQMSFNIWKLVERINTKEYRRKNPAFVYDRLKMHKDWITLSPLDQKERAKAHRNSTGTGNLTSLTLEFVLGQRSLSETEVKELARHVARACKTAKVKTRNVKWIDFKQRNTFKQVARSSHFIARMGSFARSRQSSTPAAQQENAMTAPPTPMGGIYTDHLNITSGDTHIDSKNTLVGAKNTGTVRSSGRSSKRRNVQTESPTK
ncbi:uncharacterized protein K452DRAFT_275975 [Aplosporella prunicola CBS 121167]|uniref:Uncharacterized protein n=1 Tax=Aplosporella prunicola CBS 121167 TaxID=1176127 RepID=A0A6A6B7W3_9PEZI|nr:uncharacterized protein K452DRAFT_275975 [Aplosporella prunicola CBS 121167]KAF2139027.1 hypothetical protein K452DRAFT_275975 [Aplosporella prunicola CBS 121167]